MPGIPHRFLGLMWAMILALASHGQTTLYVDDDSPAGGSGLSWSSAMQRITDALAAAGAPGSTVDEIRVAQGVYVEAILLVNNVPLRGGFAGLGAPNPDLHDPQQFPSILSGDVLGNDQPGFTNYQDNLGPLVRATGNEGTATLEGMVVRGGRGYLSGGFHAYDGPPEVILSDCVFEANFCEKVTGAIRFVMQTGHFQMSRCVVRGNQGGNTAGVFLASRATIEDCRFIENVGTTGGVGALAITEGPSTVTNCEFIRNVSGFVGGGLVFGEDGLVANCLFSRNQAMQQGGGAVAAGPSAALFLNCSFSMNSATYGGGLSVDDGHTIVHNSVFRDNVVQSSTGASATLFHCNYQGGWRGPGANNIDADPLFVQPGSDDLRLAFGSPCIDAGDTAALPPWLETDLLGQPRIVGAAVDIGCYEGEFDALPPMAEASDLDPGESALLVPSGGSSNPAESTLLLIMNTSGPPDSSAVMTLYEAALHPGAGGYSELGTIARVETNLQPGQHRLSVFIRVDATDLAQAGVDPDELDLTVFDPVSNRWRLAVARNTQNSPGHDSPVGDRHVHIGSPQNWAFSGDLGDYGIFWDPAAMAGTVWANLDHASDFGLGARQCPADCASPVDDLVDIADLAVLFTDWGATTSACDIDGDGIVNITDLLAMLRDWGLCP